MPSDQPLPPLPPAGAASHRPSPWRMAELEERLHALVNRQREQALRSDPETPPPAPAVGDAPPG